MRPCRRLPCLPALALLLPVAALAATSPAPPDSSRVFQLGAIEVVAVRPQGAAALEEQVAVAELRRAGRVDYAQALARTPGLAISNGGGRNEGGLYLRGFDLRQVPLYVDGIPVYVPYDGYVDLRRFTTPDVEEITVAKGFSSVLYGPNALGGAINVLTGRPAAPFEVIGSVGVLDGGAHEDLTVGSRRAGWYAQGAVSSLYQRRFRLPAGFGGVKVQPAGDRLNAERQDWRGSLKLGLTPNATDEYALVLATQQGEKGNPPYTGSRPDQKVRYWRWPQWDKDDAYLITRTALGGGSLLKGRFYYDHFQNTLCAYDDATYTTQQKKSSFTSTYDDPTYGGSLEWSLPALAGHALRAAAHGKYDLHREHNTGEPQSKVEDLTLSGSAEDTWKLTDRLTAVAGAGYANRRSLSADKYVDGALADQPTGTDAAWNGELALLCDAGRGTLRGSVARRTRFATMKDRYSYKAGSAIPNPGLDPETALHYELAWAGAARPGVRARLAVFYSRIADLIEPVDAVAFSVADGDTTWLSQTRNVGAARSMGVEVGFDARPARRLGVGAAYSYVDRRNLDHPEIKQPGTPWNAVTAYADATPLSWFRLRGSVFGYGARYAASYGLTLAPFLAGELRGTIDVAPGVAVEGGVANLLDARYELDEGFPEPGRSWFADVRFALPR
jgi:iron complex outermembrane recepter protein